MTPKIAIIIVTYNATKWADQCFRSIRNSSVPVQVYVIDNGSTDGTQKFIKEKFPEIDLTISDKNLGFGKANNLGIEKAYQDGADFFYLMNQDAWLFADTLEKLLDVYESFPNQSEIGILSPMHLDGSEKKLDIFLDKYIAQNFEKTRLISDLYFQTLENFYEIRFINAAHWLLPRKTVESVGGFNSYYFHYGEDIEYVNRVKFHRKKIILVPESRAVHDGKQQLNKVDYSLYADLTVETNILNPNLSNAFHSEKKSLQQSMIKAALTGNLQSLKKLYGKYRKISAEKKTLTDLAAKTKEVGLTFLNL